MSIKHSSKTIKKIIQGKACLKTSTRKVSETWDKQKNK